MRFLTVLMCFGALAFAVDYVQADEPKKSDKKAQSLNFKLKDTDGKMFDTAKMKDKLIVLEWIEPGCPTCRRHAKEGSVNHLVKKYAKKKDVVVVGICTSNRTDTAAMKAFAEQHKLGYKILMDPTGQVGRQFGAKKTPHMFIIKNGKKLYEGAMDDDARGRKPEAERVSYISKALDEIIAGKKVSTSYTKPYG